MLRNKDIFSQSFCVFFVRSGTFGTTLVSTRIIILPSSLIEVCFFFADLDILFAFLSLFNIFYLLIDVPYIYYKEEYDCLITFVSNILV